MLFTSPMFAFLFLPAALLLYLAFGKRHKRAFLLAICLCFHLLLNFYRPWLLLLLPIMILYTWFGGMAVMRYRKSLFIFLVCVLPYLGLVLLRNLAHWEGSDFAYPVGMTLAAMSSTSYLLEAVRGNIKKRNRLFDLSLYILFFPTMIVGPFIKYPEFLRLTEEDHIEPSVRNLADGALLFAEGMIKRIAIGAVLVESFEEILERFRTSPDLMVGIFLLILIYFGVYFVITGYSDMACGIARMFGIRIRHTPSTPFRAAIPDEYSHSLFPTLPEWLEDYVVCPLLRMSGGRFPHAIHALAYGGCLLLFVRPTMYVLLLAIPSIGIEYLFVRFRADQRLAHRGGMRVIFTLITMLVVSVGWIFITMGDVTSVLEYISHITYENSEYHTDLILVTFSGTKYLLIVGLSALMLLPGFGFKRFLHRFSNRGQAIGEGIYMSIVLLLFIFTILFFLPQYPQYSTVPFRYVYI